MTQEEFDKLILLYKKFCKDAVITNQIDSNSLNDFLGWIEYNWFPSEK